MTAARPAAGEAGAEAEAREIVLQNPGAYPEGEDPSLPPWLERLLDELAPGASFTARLTSDREVRRLNRTYRGIDRATDVLSFPGEIGPEGAHLGDVVISVPALRRQAEEAGHAPARELRVLILHGILHCLGHDHETDDGEMETLEDRLRERWVYTPAETGEDEVDGS